MSKYSNELKLEIVKYCIEKFHSKYDIAKTYTYHLVSKVVRSGNTFFDAIFQDGDVINIL